MKIGEVALASGTQVETIRFYEREGLLPVPQRSEGNYRIYAPDHIERLRFIRHCRCLDMTLDEIRLLLEFKDAPQTNCEPVNKVLDEHIAHVALRVRELKALHTQLRELRAQCTSAGDACGVIDGLSSAAKDHDHAESRKGYAHAHVAGVHGGNPRRQAGKARLT
jgi:Cd(II)/Pb(II)-responsive transcriptional regulator